MRLWHINGATAIGLAIMVVGCGSGAEQEAVANEGAEAVPAAAAYVPPEVPAESTSTRVVVAIGTTWPST